MIASDLSDVFVSYRRVNVEFAKKLVEYLNKEGKEVWVDWEDIPPGSEAFTDDIKRGLEGADAFICILTPDYLESPYCLDMELGYALELKKKIIPIVLDKFEGMNVPSSIGHINWIYFVPHAGAENTFEEAFPRVMDALNQDYEHAREHRRLGLRAIEWQDNGHSNSFLLIGDELTSAENWLMGAVGKVPEPTELHSHYITSSREEDKRNKRQRRFVAGVIVVISLLTVIAISLGIVANIQREEAQTQANIAATNAQDAENNASTAVLALDEAELQAQIAATQAAIAKDSAATATIAQGEAIIEANNAATQANIAGENALTATVAQGLAQIAATGEAVARQTAAFVQEANANSTQAAIAAVAATEVNKALAISEANALTATIAQGEAEFQALTATIAQGEAELQAAIAATQAVIAQDSAATATIAQGEAIIEANNAAIQAAIALDNAATATIAQGQAQLEANAAATAEQIAEQRRAEAQAQALIVRAEQARLFGDANVALALALQAAALNPDLLQAQSVLNQAAAVSPRLSIANVQMTAMRPEMNQILVQSVSNPTRLILWDIDAQASLYEINTSIPIEDFAFSLDGQTIITATGENGISLWAADTGALIVTARDQVANRVLVHPNSTQFVSAGMDGVIFVRDIETAEILRELTNTVEVPYDQLRFNTDGRWLYAWSIEPPVVRSIWSFEEPDNNVRRNVEDYLLVSDDNAFRVNRVEGQFVIHNMDGDGATLVLDGDVRHIYAFSPDNNKLLVSGQDGRFGQETRYGIVDRQTGEIDLLFPAVPEIEVSNGIIEGIFLSAQTILTIQPDNDILISDSETGEPIRNIGISSVPITLEHVTDTQVVVLTENNTALIFDRSGLGASLIENPDEQNIAIEKIKSSFLAEGGLYGELYDLDWQLESPRGRYSLRTFDGFNIILENARTNEEIALIPNRLGEEDSTLRIFSPDEKFVVLGWRSGHLRVWDIEKGEVAWDRDYRGTATNLEEIIFLPDTDRFIAFHAETAVLWDIGVKSAIRALEIPNLVSPLSRNDIINNGNVHKWMFVERHNRVLAEGKIVTRILFDENDLKLRLIQWDTDTGNVLIERDLHEEIVVDSFVGARFSPNGQTYVRIGRSDNVVEMFNTLTGVRIRRFIGHDTFPVGVAFNPNGERLVTASEDGAIILWDVQTGQLVRVLVQGSPLNGISQSLNIVISPDNTVIGFTRDDTPIPSSNLDVVRVETLSDVVEWVTTNRNIRELSCSEREQYSVLPLCDGGIETPTPTATVPSILVISSTPTATPVIMPTATPLVRGVIQADSNVNMRSGPGEGFSIVETIVPDTIVIILNPVPDGGWLEIEMLDGTQGWVLDGVVAR